MAAVLADGSQPHRLRPAPADVFPYIAVFVFWCIFSARWIHELASGINEHARRNVFTSPTRCVVLSFIPILNLLWMVYFIGKCAITIERFEVRAGFKRRPKIITQLLVTAIFMAVIWGQTIGTAAFADAAVRDELNHVHGVPAGARSLALLLVRVWLCIALAAPPTQWLMVCLLHRDWASHMERHGATIVKSGRLVGRASETDQSARAFIETLQACSRNRPTGSG